MRSPNAAVRADEIRKELAFLREKYPKDYARLSAGLLNELKRIKPRQRRALT